MNAELIFRAIIAALFIAFIAHRGYYSRKFSPSEDATLEKQTADPISRIAALISLPALISTALYVVYPASIAWASFSMPPLIRLLSVVIALLGFTLLQWSHAALGRNWSDHPRILEGQRLVMTGPYRWIRHPMYTSFLLILGSTLLISANMLVGGLWIIATSLDATGRIRFEEKKLRSMFGDAYDSYKERTGLLLPWL